MNNKKTLIIKLVATIFLACCFYIPAMFITGIAMFFADDINHSGAGSEYLQPLIAILTSLYLGFSIANKYKSKE